MSSVLLAVAANTWKQLVRDRIFYIVLVMAMMIIGFSYLLATLTFIESRKILLDFGFSAVSLSGGMTAVFIGVVAVAREIEQRTIYTVITKPISRVGYLGGKFLGSLAALAATHLLMALVLWGILFELGEGYPPGLVPCLFLIFLENTILLAVAFLCSSFSSSLVAAGLTVSFFLIGRSHSSFEVMGQRGHTGTVRALGRALYYAMPNLERYNIRDVVAYGRPYPGEMPWIGLAYAGAWVAVCLAVSGMVLQKRDMP